MFLFENSENSVSYASLPTEIYFGLKDAQSLDKTHWGYHNFLEIS